MERNHTLSPAEAPTPRGAHLPRAPSAGIAGRWTSSSPARSGRVSHEQAKRAAPGRREGVRGETRAARLDAKREGPARSEAQGDVQACEAEDTTRRKATPCHGWNGERLQENNGEKGKDIRESMDRKARKGEPGGFRRRAERRRRRWTDQSRGGMPSPSATVASS